MNLNSPEIDKLARLVEEATRAGKKTVGRFVEPARGTLDRAKSSRHHIIFGRRGSGKTSLLQKAYSDLTVFRKPASYVDLETFKGHTYPDVLLSVLISSISEFETWLKSAGTYSVKKASFWNTLFGRTPTGPPIDKKQRESVSEKAMNIRLRLEQLLHAQDGAEISTKKNQTDTHEKTDQGLLGFDAGPIQGKASDKLVVSKGKSTEVQEKLQRSKIQYLHQYIMEFRKLFSDIAALGNGDAYLFLDDLYHIRKEDQASVLDYFHRIAKNTGVWIKVGTIRHRTDHYRHGNPPTGMKLGDDADEVDLDLTLEKYDLAKGFLNRILGGLLQEAGIQAHSDILTDGAIDRLVLASGGVARDFLTIFRRSIDCARESGDEEHDHRIGAEDVNRASGEHDGSKRDELRRDTAEDSGELESAFGIIRDFCLDEANANCFLVERDVLPDRRFIIDELVDLKMLHHVHSRVTVSDHRGKVFVGYMLDLSQYAGDRKRRGLNMIEFWNESARDALRRTGLIFELSRLSPPSAAQPVERN